MCVAMSFRSRVVFGDCESEAATAEGRTRRGSRGKGERTGLRQSAAWSYISVFLLEIDSNGSRGSCIRPLNNSFTLLLFESSMTIII